MIPACIYGNGVKDGQSEYITILAAELEAHLRDMKKSGVLLATSIFELSDGRSAIIKEIQYHRTNYKVLHIDFYIVDKKEQVTVNVPIQIDGKDECVGVKLGGFLRQVIRTLKVQCLPSDIPPKFTIDVRDLNHTAEGDKKPNKSKRLSDIALPKGVKPLLTDMNQVAVSVGKRT
jgi:large subunit ribosomal protein L25